MFNILLRRYNLQASLNFGETPRNDEYQENEKKNH